VVLNAAEYCANKATFHGQICTQIGCSHYPCNCFTDLKSDRDEDVCTSTRRRALVTSSSVELQVTAALPNEPAYASTFANVQKYAGWLVNSPTPTVGQGDVAIISASAVSAGTKTTSFVAPAPSPPPPSPLPPASPSPPPKGGLPGEACSVGIVKDYTTEFKSNVDGCLAKKAVPVLVARIAELLSSAVGYSFSPSMVHVTALATSSHQPWDNTASGAGLCPVDTGRRLEARRLDAPKCSTTLTTSCYCSMGACYQQTTFAVVIQVAQADATAAAAAAAAVTSTMDAIKAAMFSNAAVTTLFPALLTIGELQSIIQLAGSTDTSVSGSKSATICGATASTASSPPPAVSSVSSPPPATVSTDSPPPPSPMPPPAPKPPPSQCACDTLINGADPFNTCVKIQGKKRICSGIGLTSSGQSLCPSDFLLCPSSLALTSASGSGSGGECKDKEGKYADKKCKKKQAAGKCSNKKMKKKCRKTCGHC